MSSFPTQTQAELKALLLAALRNHITGLDTSDRSDAAIKAGALAHVLEGLYGRVDWTGDQVFPDSASSANLERHADARGLSRLAATTSEGTVAFTGTTGTPIPIGTSFTKSDGWEYQTTTAAVWVGGDATAEAVAVEAGVDGNVSTGEAFTLSAPIAGVDSECEAGTDFTGGTDIETDAALLQRLLDNLRSPPAGGTAEDWRQWAQSVDGVTEAYSHPLRRGPGTIDVTVFTAGPDGDRALPGAALITSVETYVETVRPITVGSYQIVTATEVATDVTVDDLDVEDGYVEADVQAAVESAIAGVFPTLAPGETLYVTSHLHEAINAVAGVLDYTLTAPAANVTATIDASDVEVLTAGTVTVNLP